MRPMFARISFERTDRKKTSHVQIAGRLAEFLVGHEGYIDKFFRLLRHTPDKVCIGDGKKKFMTEAVEPHLKYFREKRSKSQADEDYISLIEKAMEVCKNVDDINELRGLIPEHILECIYKQAGLSAKIWVHKMGCVVSIDSKPVRCADPEDRYDTRQTVDFGCWNCEQQYGIFIEAKVAPDSFGKLDALYLNELRKRLEAANLGGQHSEYLIFLFAIDSREYVKEKARQAGLEMNERVGVMGTEGLPFASEFYVQLTDWTGRVS